MRRPSLWVTLKDADPHRGKPMPATRPAVLVALLGLSACQSAERSADAAAGGPAARPDALVVADALRAADGVGDVIVEEGAVVAVIEAPIPGAGLDDAARTRIGDAARGTFTAATCAQAGLDSFFAAGGTLVLRVRGSDGASVAEVPVSSCA